jgi:hypothetical protein
MLRSPPRIIPWVFWPVEPPPPLPPPPPELLPSVARPLRAHSPARLVGQVRLDLGLGAAEHEGAEDLVQARDDEQLLLLRQRGRRPGAAGAGARRGHPGTAPAVAQRRGEPLVERRRAVEHLRQHEVQQRPQLGEAVLQGRARQQDPVRGRQRAQRRREPRVGVLEPMPLVDHEQAPPPRQGPQRARVPHREVVVGQQRVERPRPREPLLADGAALLRRAVVEHRGQPGSPPRELGAPVGEHGLGGQDQVRPRQLPALEQVRDERDRLHGLAEPHLVGEDAVDLVVHQRGHEPQARDLVRPQLAARNQLRLRDGAVADGVDAAVVFALRAEQVPGALVEPLLLGGVVGGLGGVVDLPVEGVVGGGGGSADSFDLFYSFLVVGVVVVVVVARARAVAAACVAAAALPLLFLSLTAFLASLLLLEDAQSLPPLPLVLPVSLARLLLLRGHVGGLGALLGDAGPQRVNDGVCPREELVEARVFGEAREAEVLAVVCALMLIVDS